MKKFNKFKKVSPRRVVETPRQLVTTRMLTEGATLPLVVEPAVDDLDHSAWLQSRADWIQDMLYRHGALLFRGFNLPAPSDFETFAGHLTEGLYGNYGDLPPAEGKIYKVTPYPPSDPILFHNESSHTHQWPMRQFFYCNLPAAEGGETPIVDCRAIYNALEPEIIQLLEQKGLRYVRNFIEGVDVPWQDFFKTDDRAEVEAVCRRNGTHLSWKDNGDLMTWQEAPAIVNHPVTGETVFFNQIQLHHISCLKQELRDAVEAIYDPLDLPRNVYLGDGSILEDDIVARITECYWEHSVQFRWQHGDVLMVDNMLISHARRPYTPPRKMFVAMGNIIKAHEVVPT